MGLCISCRRQLLLLRSRLGTWQSTCFPAYYYVMIRTLWVIRLVPPQYVSLSRPFHLFPLFFFCLCTAPSRLIYDDTLLNPFQLCLPMSRLVFGSLSRLSI